MANQQWWLIKGIPRVSQLKQQLFLAVGSR